jgi:hypothetical protein
MNCCRGCVRRTVIDIAVSNGSGWVVFLSILAPKDVNEPRFRSVLCSEYRTVSKYQKRNSSQWYRQQWLLKALQFALWHPVISAGLLDGVSSSLGDDHREWCLRSSTECWSQKFENLIYDGVKVKRVWIFIWTSVLRNTHWPWSENTENLHYLSYCGRGWWIRMPLLCVTCIACFSVFVLIPPK